MLSQQPASRYWFIELIAWWEERISTTHLTKQFGISRRQAQSDIQHYCHLQPANLTYHPSIKGYQPTSQFTFSFISGDVVEYLNWVSHNESQLATTTASLPFTALTLPARHIEADIMRVLIAAIRQQRRLEVDYVSMSAPDREGRIIVPHHFVSTGLRWHLRAFCEKSQQFRDFVLSRFRGIPELLNKATVDLQQDIGWNTELTLVFQPDKRLTPQQQEVVAHDYQMQNNQLHINTRACLAHYLLQEMQVNIRNIDISPEAQQLDLVNLQQIKSWLFDEKS